GLVMLAICAFGVRAINQLQSNLANILNQNVASLRAAQDLEIKLRQLRFHFLAHVGDPTEERAELIKADHKGFEQALDQARTAAATSEERKLIDRIAKGYPDYRAGLEQDGHPNLKSPRDLIRWIDAHRVRELVAPCQDLLQLNQREMQQTAEESE